MMWFIRQSLFVSVVARQQPCLDVRTRADHGERANIGGNLRCGEFLQGYSCNKIDQNLELCTSAPVARVQPGDRVRVQHGCGRGEGDSAGGSRVRVVPRQQMDRLLSAVWGRNEVRICQGIYISQ